jgi:hypothetical protein
MVLAEVTLDPVDGGQVYVTKANKKTCTVAKKTPQTIKWN